MKLRPYQSAAINSIYSWFANGKKAPLIVTPTGSGKSIILAEFIRRACTEHPDTHILVVTHVKELVDQDAKAIKAVWEEADIGVYSAGLRQRELKPTTVASIQSIYKKPEFHGRFDLIIVDEAHLIPHNSEGMYRQLLDSSIKANPDTKLIGLTATPFRLNSGLLHEGEGALFDGVSYEANVADLIEQGYLSKLVSRNGDKVNLDGIKKVGGEFNLGQLGERMSAIALVEHHADLIVERCATRNSWLIFAVTVEHAKQIDQALYERGIASAYVTGDMSDKERDKNIAAFTEGKVKALVNCAILTTGFNHPALDAVIMLRPTMSAGLYAQMVGRGLRLHETKKDCLVLDFGGNILRHGFIDQIEVKKKGKGESQDAPVKECPDCHTFAPINSAACESCGHEFPKPERKSNQFHHDGAVVSIDVPPVLMEVQSVDYAKHISLKSGIATMRVSYRCGLQSYDEYVCLDHDGFAKTKAANWWRKRNPSALPASVDQALRMTSGLIKPKSIEVNIAKKYPEIIRHNF